MSRKIQKKPETENTDIIACFLSFGKDHAIEAKISEGLSSAVKERGYSPVNAVVPIDPRAEVRRIIHMFGDRIRGIAIQPFRPNRELAELLLTPPVNALPHMVIGHYFSNLQLNSCVIDNYGGMYAITEHLVNCGRKRFSFFGEVSLSSTEHERFQGFVMACLHHGIRVEPNRIVRSYFEMDIRNVLKAMFESPDPPDAIVCLFDGLAGRVLRALKDLRIAVPQRVAVVSFGDDQDIADQCEPPLSTAFHPAREMGSVAAHQLINLIEGRVPSTPSIYVVPVGLHIRESCGTPSKMLVNGNHFWKIPFSNYIGVCKTVEDVNRHE